MSRPTLGQTIGKYYEECGPDPDGREQSWVHCYEFFRKHRGKLEHVEDIAALHLGFYLASWGMYRGSGFLWQYAYTAHIPVVRALAEPQFSNLWLHSVGEHDDDVELSESIMALAQSVKAAYAGFAKQSKPSGTLITKVLLGTVACLPACDRYFIDGFRAHGSRYSGVNRSFVDHILRFCIDNRQELAEQQSEIIDHGGPRYPLMKLVDMYFWQTGKVLSKPPFVSSATASRSIRGKHGVSGPPSDYGERGPKASSVPSLSGPANPSA